MGSKIDKIKGRIKEAIGALTDNDNLQREGQRDQVVGEVKELAVVERGERRGGGGGGVKDA